MATYFFGLHSFLRYFLAGVLFGTLETVAYAEDSCSPPREGLYTFLGFEAPIRFEQPGAVEYLVLKKSPVVDHLYTGRLVIMPEAIPSLKVPGRLHGVFDPGACELYGILYTPATGFNLAFVYQVNNDSMIGLDVSRNFRLRPTSSWGLHIFSYQGSNVTLDSALRHGETMEK